MKPRHAGFTLSELLITLAVAGIVATLAAPPIANLMREAQLTTTINSFAGALRAARSEAVTRRQWVRLCTADATGCVTDAAGWEAGWLMFVDVNRDGDCQDADGDLACDGADDGGEIIRRGAALPAGYLLRGNSQLGDTVTFRDDGTSRGTPGSIFLCLNATDPASRRLVLANSGRLRLEEDPAQTCP